MNKDNERYKALAAEYGEEMATIFIAQDEKRELERQKNQSLSSRVACYGDIAADVENTHQRYEHRKDAEGKDFYINEINASFDNDPKIIKAKKELEQRKQFGIDDNEYWNDFHKKAKQEHDSNESLRKKFGDKVVDSYLAEREYKKFNKQNGVG